VCQVGFSRPVFQNVVKSLERVSVIIKPLLSGWSLTSQAGCISPSPVVAYSLLEFLFRSVPSPAKFANPVQGIRTLYPLRPDYSRWLGWSKHMFPAPDSFYQERETDS